MSENSPPLYLSRDQVRAVDRVAIEEFGMPGVVLMENAGRGSADLLIKQGIDGLVVICCGKGNNGGDGFVIARHLEIRGYSAKILLFTNPDSLTGDAAINYKICKAAKTPIEFIEQPEKNTGWILQLEQADWIVDALLGTGIKGELRDPFPSIINAINATGKNILAVDLPSGLDCDTGEPLGTCVKATFTVSFVAEKSGFTLAKEFTGPVSVVDIGVPRSIIARCSKMDSADN